MQLIEKQKVIEYANQTDLNPTVSVCITTFNHYQFIKMALDSVLKQKTNFEFEILLSEDDSNDGTREICIEYAKKYPSKIKLFLHSRENNITINNKPTGRFPFIWNLQKAKGKYIALLDGDDYWTNPLKLQKQIDFMESNPEVVLNFHLCQYLVNDKLIHQPKSQLDYDYTIKNLLSKWNIPTGSMLLRNIFKENSLPDWFYLTQSGDISLAMLLYDKGKFELMNEYMSTYRLRIGVSKYHKELEMIKYRAEMYAYFDHHFNYLYHDEIYQALDSIIKTFSSQYTYAKIKDEYKNFKVLKSILVNNKLVRPFFRILTNIKT